MGDHFAGDPLPRAISPKMSVHGRPLARLVPRAKRFPSAARAGALVLDSATGGPGVEAGIGRAVCLLCCAGDDVEPVPDAGRCALMNASQR